MFHFLHTHPRLKPKTLFPSLLFTNPKPTWNHYHHHHLSLSTTQNPSITALLQNPNLSALNSILRSYAQGPTPEQSISLYGLMRQTGILPDNYTFPFVFKGCGRLSLIEKGEETHSLSLKLGFEFDVFVQNSLIYMYSACRKVDIARKVFDYIPLPVYDVVTWNSMLSGYLYSNLCDEALRLFGEMGVSLVRVRVRPNELTAVTALTACARLRDVGFGEKMHAFVTVNGFVLDFYLGSSLIDMYVKCGRIKDAWKVFDRMPKRNVFCWTSMIAGCAQLGMFKEAIGLFREMQVEGVEADDATIACVVSACAHLGALDQGRWVHAYCDKNGIELNVTVKNALIDMYSKCGDIEEALQIFNGLVRRDVFSWTVMISGLAMNGNSRKALDLFSEMQLSKEVFPNEVTYLGVLSACSHSGLVDEGYCYFDCMKRIYNLVPRIEHYGCMVDLLGRANLLVEAEEFVMKMPIQPDVVIWRSLLFACRSHGNIELAEFAAKRILELEPRKCGAHVLLSNVYAVASRWSDAKRVRKGMNARGIRKQPGCAFIEINGVVHEFLVADRLHPQSEQIFEMIFQINNLLSSLGYVSDIVD